MKHLFTLKSLLLTLVMLCGLNAWGETPVYSLTFSVLTGKANSAYEKAHDTESNGVFWTVYGNQTLTNPVLGVGGKSISNVGRTLTSQSAVSTSAISKITLNHGGISNASLKINSITIEGSTVSDFSSDVKIATITSPTLEKNIPGSLDFFLESGDWDANSYFRITVNCTNTKSSNYRLDISSVDFYGVSAAVTVDTPKIIETSTANSGNSYYTTSTATATIDAADVDAIKYAITDGAAQPTTWSDYSKGAVVEIASTEPATKTLWAKAVKGLDESTVAKKEFTFINPPKQLTFTKVTDASQLVAGAKYAIINATTTKIVSGYDGSTYTSTTPSETNGIVKAMDNQVIVFTLGGNGDNSWTLYDNTKGKFVGGNSEIDFKFGDDASALKKWTIAFVDTKGSVKIYYGTRGFNFSSKGAVKNYATSNYGNSDYTYPTLWKMVEGTETGLDAVLVGEVGNKYQINTPLCVNYKDDNYVYASTTKGGFTKTAPTEAQKEEWWSDKAADFNQNDWVAIQGLVDVQVGAEIEAGSVATLVSNDAFPVVEFVTESHTTGTAIEANTYRVANFDSNNELVKKLWLVEPQPAEHCYVKGYVASLGDVVKIDGVFVAEIKSGEKDVVTMYVNYNPADFSITATGWYLFEGVVVNGTSGLELNAVNVNKGTATGVEGVETSSVKVYGAEGVINVVSEEVAPIAVYSANGAIVSSVEASSASIAVAPGFYIVKAGNSVSKVTVK